MTKIEAGTKVQWTSMCGLNVGTVSKVWLALNAAGDLIPWMLIEYAVKGRKTPATAMLAATPTNLLMMKVKAA